MTMKIAGGVYREICLFPERREILGSGGRAAAALSLFNKDIELHAFIPQDLEGEVRLSLAAYNFKLAFHQATHLIAFRWLHGLASPQQQPSLDYEYQPLTMAVEGDIVLRYGMVEGSAIVKAEKAVYDPQGPLRAEHFSKNGSSAKRVAYVVNSSEARLLTSEFDPYKQLQSIHSQSRDISVVVLKQGPHGALVSDGQRTTRVPCFKTQNVWPIGSGDVFSASFCHFWAVENLEPAKSAYLASLATAYYCNSGYLPLPVDYADNFSPNACNPTTKKDERRKIYLAGPFFTVSQRWLIDSLRETFRKLDVDVFSPIHDVGEGDAEFVAKEDLIGIDESDVVFAVCDGFDPGTIFEIGYAISKQKKVIAFTQLEDDNNLTMIRGSGCIVERDLDTAIYKAVWEALER